MNNKLSKEVRNTINQLPWDELVHAYGSAKDAPQEFENLFSENEVQSGNAYYDWLLSAVFHQYTMYSATYGAVRVVLSMLKTMNVSQLTIDEDRADKMLLDWLKVCAESSKKYPDVEEEIINGNVIFQNFSQSEDKKVKELASFLVNWCKKVNL